MLSARIAMRLIVCPPTALPNLPSVANAGTRSCQGFRWKSRPSVLIGNWPVMTFLWWWISGPPGAGHAARWRPLSPKRRKPCRRSVSSRSIPSLSRLWHNDSISAAFRHWRSSTRDAKWLVRPGRRMPETCNAGSRKLCREMAYIAGPQTRYRFGRFPGTGARQIF